MEDKYITYSIEDFLADDRFVSWVYNKTDDTFWQLWIQQHPSKKSMLDEAEILLNQLKLTETKPDELWKQNLWHGIRSSISQKPSIIRRLTLISSAAAACFLIFYIFKFAGNESAVEMSNQTASTVEHILPDASFVILDSKSFISYDKNTFNKKRTVTLKGRAFFEVQKGIPFEVNTNQGKVEVLGTSFNVATRGHFEVTCYSGKVRVTKGGASVILTPGEQTNFGTISENKTTVKLEEDNLPGWVSGSVKFENAKLSEVLTALELAYGVRIEMDEQLKKSKVYTGYFVKNDIDKALMSITWPLHLKYELEGDKVKIYQEE
ncbi:MAG: FecR domain-containing protein [Saprospiraceae bacterium]|nr:FecR domain-containing protein [Saprospiraceae bacterium]